MTDEPKSDQLTREQIVEKVKKLLALAKGSDYEGEVAQAMAMARKLLAKYNLSMSDVESQAYEKADPGFSRPPVKGGYWQMKLALIVGKTVNCRAFWSGKQITFIGMPAELEICTYTFVHVADQIDKMMRKFRRDLRDQREAEQGRRQDRKDSSYNTRGYVDGMLARLDERFKEMLRTESSSTALVLVTHPQVQRWCVANLGGVRPRKVLSASEQASARGYADGDKITLNKGIRNNGNGKPSGFIE